MSNDLDQIRQTARAIEIAWSITRDGEEFAQEIENRGLILVYVSREEGKDSHRARAFAGEIDGQRRELKEDLAVVDRHGNVTSIDQRTTGDQWEKIQKRLARIDRRKLVSVAEARDIMADANRAEFREKKRGEQDAARAVAVAEKKILDADNAAQSLDQELSPEDCLHHCRFSLTKLEYEIAISKIKLYGLTKVAVSMDALPSSSYALLILNSGDTTMTEPTTQPIKIDGYHAHIYYDPTTRARAAQLRETIASALGVEVRELSDEPRGPHAVPQFRFTFTAAQFENIVPWLMLNRQGLDVLVHPLTDNSYDDHSRYAVWLGSPMPLRLNPMSRTYRAEQYPPPR